MAYRGFSQSSGQTTSHRAVLSKTAGVLPTTVSQLLSAAHIHNDAFSIGDLELSQVSVVGIVRGFAPFVTNIQYSVDDMTGPPLKVMQWVNTEDCALMTSIPTGVYVKVVGSLVYFSGQRSLLAKDIRLIKDLNEITSHILEVVQAQMHLSGKVFDVNMNTPVASLSSRLRGGHPEGMLSNGLSTIQGQVLQVIRRFSVHEYGISLCDLKRQLDYLTMMDIRTSLAVLLNEGHVFCTIDENHFKSAVC
ncbi:replication protein A 32 kDa subunit-like [Acanthochromis polyacanthus]|uniref:replication protein A 32 kDa subunit-like n=1 Tax=Acanthochromis polyacanthus TaxID=80966 RepID=UPI000B8FB42B|nr:replication protein A 32 kDa subunit-like [Acanthochromis polyacanthus]